jgi:alkylation response protein AidB-like acyl-CoA dehydrogenase
MKVYIPTSVIDKIEGDLKEFGDKVVGGYGKNDWSHDPNRQDYCYMKMAYDAEDTKPYLVKHDVYGERIDKIVTSEGWRFFKPQAAKEGLIAIPYENEFAQYSRVYQVIKLFLFAPSSGLFSCPLAMTDGAAFTIKQLLNKKDISDTSKIEDAYKHLTSRDPNEFWTSGQWMTEKKGGSDVANGTFTIAQPEGEGGECGLYGYKWFTSATDSDMTLTLARSLRDGNPIPGNKGLSLFFGKVRDENGKLNNLEVVRLKDKLGTRQLPTGEILLKGMKAQKLGKEGEGVRLISNMLNITRLHNSISAVSNMRRITALARDFSDKRVTFGKKIKEHTLHIRTLSWMENTFRGNLCFLFNIALLLGKIDNGTVTSDEKHLFRLLTPLLKLFTAKDAMAVTSEGLECFGGIGYMENSYLPVIFRDSQVLPIWEGTTNILSLDLLRAILKYPLSLDIFYDHLKNDLATQDINSLTPFHKAAVEKLSKILDLWYKSIISIARDKKYMEYHSRDFAIHMSMLYICHKLMVVYTATKNEQDYETFLFWVKRLSSIEHEYSVPKESRMLECYLARDKLMALDEIQSQQQLPNELKAKI